MKHALTDLGNSFRFVDDWNSVVRYSKEAGWLHFNGKYWEPSEDDAVRLACETAAKICHEADHLGNDKVIEAVQKWGKRSQMCGSIMNMVRLARSNDEIRIPGEKLNRDHTLLNAQNGTIDLRTGLMREHRPEDFITCIASVQYDPDAECPMWEAFITQIMNGNKDMARSLQLIAGYAATGFVSERCIFILHGMGANGKSVYLDTIARILGGYATTVPTSALMQKASAQTNDLASLMDKRFVMASESEASAHLAESIVKSITGDRNISARFLYREYFVFRPTFTVFLATNHKPVVKHMDPAIWARIKLFPFTYTVPPEDRIKDYDDLLYEKEASGILRWIVDGAVAWFASGKSLNLAKEIDFATDDYKKEQDIIGQFIEDKIYTGAQPGFMVSKSTVYNEYKKWCDETGHRPLAMNKFSSELRLRGYKDDRTVSLGRVWRGISLLSTIPEDAGLYNP